MQQRKSHKSKHIHKSGPRAQGLDDPKGPEVHEDVFQPLLHAGGGLQYTAEH